MTTPDGILTMHYQHNRLQQLRGFYHAARANSITKAAEKLALSQPSVSLQGDEKGTGRLCRKPGSESKTEMTNA